MDPITKLAAGLLTAIVLGSYGYTTMLNVWQTDRLQRIEDKIDRLIERR